MPEKTQPKSIFYFYIEKIRDRENFLSLRIKRKKESSIVILMNTSTIQENQVFKQEHLCT